MSVERGNSTGAAFCSSFGVPNQRTLAGKPIAGGAFPMRRVAVGGRKTGTVRTSVLAVMVGPIVIGSTIAMGLGAGSLLPSRDSASMAGVASVASVVDPTSAAASPELPRKSNRMRTEALVTGAAMEIAISVPRS
jgi:hypothetical protein